MCRCEDHRGGRTVSSRPLRCLADGLGIGGIVLLPFDKRLHVGWRNQTNLMTKPSELARPIMGAAASLHRHQGLPAKNANTCLRRSRFRKTTLPDASAPCA
jgi:hypothetical protein